MLGRLERCVMCYHELQTVGHCLLPLMRYLPAHWHSMSNLLKCFLHWNLQLIIVLLSLVSESDKCLRTIYCQPFRCTFLGGRLSISWLGYMTSWNMSHSQNSKASELFHINHVYFLWGLFEPREPWLILYACLYPCFVAGEVEKLPLWQKSYVVLLNECDLSHAWSVFPPCPVFCSYHD